MKTESGKWKVVVLICISMAFHFPLFSFSPLQAQSPIGIKSTYAESHAAEQLKVFLEKGGCKTISGKRTDHTIHVGLALEMKQRYQSIVDTLHDGGYFIIGDGRDIVLYGAGEKGTLYAVYAFLEKLGFRLYTPDAMVVPDLSKSIPLSAFRFHIVENPAFAYREVTYYYPNHSQLYADWHHLHTQADRNERFGMYVHTFAKLLPPERYYDEHPEWYSLNNGRRMRDGQLCLSNPQVLEALCRRLADTMAAFPQKTIWSVSPNDNYNACTCVACRHLDSLYGGPSGTLLWFVNQVARRFPEKTIATLAYQYTRKAPQVERRRLAGKTDTEETNADETPTLQPNVLVMLCPIEAGRQAPIAESDPAFSKDIDDWSRLTGNLYVWDYVVQFRNFWNPFPNLHVLQPNLQFFKEHGTTMMFEQATGSDNITSWMDIRCYMIAKLLWNPDADIDSIMADFYHGYYKGAGPFIKEIIDTMTSALIQSGQRLDIYGYPIDAAEGYLSPDRMRLYDSLMFEAEETLMFESVETHGVDSALFRRLKYFWTPLVFARVELSANSIPGYSGRPADIMAFLRGLFSNLEEFEVPQMMEMGITPQEYFETMDHWFDKRWKNKAQDKSVTLRRPATAPYNTAGLTDGEAGIMDYRHSWLGFWGDTLDAVVDLGEPQPIRYIGIDFFFYPLSWIFLPQWVRFAVSEDGERWEWRSKQEIENPEVLATPDIYTYALETACTIGGEPNRYRYVRVVAVPLKEIPSWHRAAGQQPWIFTDEIIVK